MAKITGFIKELLLEKQKPFTDKRDLNTKVILRIFSGLIVLLIIGLLVWPESKPEMVHFKEKRDADGRLIDSDNHAQSSDLDEEALARLRQRSRERQNVPSLESLMRGASKSLTGESGQELMTGGQTNQGSSMIVRRASAGSKSNLLTGTRFSVRLLQSLSLQASGSIPIQGVVEEDVLADSDVAISKGTKILGTASFNAKRPRADISWQQIVLDDGRQMALSAVAIGTDNQSGVSGKVRSGAGKETTGKVLGHFIGGFASGSMTRGQTGESEGGLLNGFKNAVSETATDQAASWAEDLKKVTPWIEIEAGKVCIAVLVQDFNPKIEGSIR